MTTGKGGTLILEPEAGSGFGARVAALGDVNGDGDQDFAVSAPAAGNGYGTGTVGGVGQTYIFYGGTGDLAAQIDLAFAGGAAPDGVTFSAMQGDIADGGLGGVLSAAGDVNGDGIGDVLIGSPGYGSAGERVAVLVYGSAEGFGAVFDLAQAGVGSVTRLTVTTGTADASFTAGGAGDLNGDGHVDVVISDPAAGAAYVLFGDGAKHPPALTMTTVPADGKNVYMNATGAFGAGDLNNDGVDDLILTTAAGAVVLFGSVTWGATTQDMAAFVPTGVNGFSMGLAQVLRAEKLSDINGDGIDDLLIEGRADTLSTLTETWVLFGKDDGFAPEVDLTALDGTDGFVMEGTLNAAGLGGTGDVNGDGFRDFVVADSSGAGSVHIIFGRGAGHPAVLDLSALDGTDGYTIHGLPGDAAGGGQIADVNGDGFGDVIFGLAGRGAAAVLYGGPERLRALDLADGARDGVLSLTQLGDVLSFTEPDPVPIGGGGGSGPTQQNDSLEGTDGADVTDLLGGNDFYGAKSGDDSIRGGIGNDSIAGDNGADTLRGDGGLDTLKGGAGDDVLDGGEGGDELDGGEGDDLYLVDSAQDRLSEIFNGGWDRVEATVSLVLGTGIEELSFLGTAGLTGEGNTLANRITGNAGGNVLKGLGGNDTLSGGAGADTLIGGAGRDRLYGGDDLVRDVFVFNAFRESGKGALRDMIGGFRPGADDIDLRLIDANRAVAGDQAFRFSDTKARAHAVWWGDTAWGVVLRGDVTGDGRYDFEIGIWDLDRMSRGDLLL